MLLLARAVIKTEDEAGKALAKEAGLRYVCDHRTGIRRIRRGKSFSFVGADGKPVRDEATLQRIARLAIPPAWSDVWICPSPQGHIQAVGRDAKGRKQYRYHAQWSAVASQQKYEHLIDFAEALGRLRHRVDRDLDRPELDRTKVIAAVVRLLDLTLIRVGNEEYAQEHNHFGLTTLRDRHVDFRGSRVRFNFVGKSGQKHDIEADAPRLARIVRRCQELPGQQLFQYVDEEGGVCGVTSEDVNGYLREVTGMDITAKDFRTWGGTVLAAVKLCRCDPPAKKKAGEKTIVETVKAVAQKLGNRPATCRKYYIHPAILTAYGEQTLHGELSRRADHIVPRRGLSAVEQSVLRMLKSHRRRQRMSITSLLDASVKATRSRRLPRGG